MAVVYDIGSSFKMNLEEPIISMLKTNKYQNSISYMEGDLRQNFELIDSTQDWAKVLAKDLPQDK